MSPETESSKKGESVQQGKEDLRNSACQFVGNFVAKSISLQTLN
jgi:hypothetical protein